MECNCECHEPKLIFGYTKEQILKMDLWFKKNALSWEVIGEAYKQGFENGVTADRELVQKHLDDLMKQMGEREAKRT